MTYTALAIVAVASIGFVVLGIARIVQITTKMKQDSERKETEFMQSI